MEDSPAEKIQFAASMVRSMVKWILRLHLPVCNSSFAHMGLTLSRTSFEDTLSSLYFNQSLPVDLTTNISKVSIGTSSSDSDLNQTVIGQGTTQMTPLHLSMITSMIANHGIMMQPYIIDRVESADGNLIKSFSPDSLGQLISEEEADILKNLMIAVVQEGTRNTIKRDSHIRSQVRPDLLSTILNLIPMPGLPAFPMIRIDRFRLQ